MDYAAGGANYHTWLPIVVSASALLEIAIAIQGALEVFRLYPHLYLFTMHASEHVCMLNEA